MVFRITGGITIDGGLTSSGREPDPPSDVSAAKVNDTTVRLTVTDPVNTGGLAITEYTAKTYISYQNPDLSFSYYLIPSATATNNINVIDVTNNYGGGDGPVEYVFDGATFFEIPYNAKFELANNSFAIEAFITPTTTNVLRGIVNNWNIGGAFNWYINTNNTLTFTYTYTTSGANEITYTGSTVIQPNVRTHVVIQKVGANMQFFINGVPDPVTYTGNFNFRFVYFYNNVKKPLRYGICSDGTGYFTGKMSNLRISFKQYLYGGGTNASFPVPSLPLETTQDAVYSGATKIIESLVPSEVLLLVLSDARPGKDKSTNDWSSALNGGVTITGKVEYVFRVTAKNAVGTSLESPASNIVRYLGPNAPTIDTATIVNNTNASVTFTPPAVNVDGPIIDYLVVSTPGNFNAIGTTSPITVSGLIKGTNYTFTVSARNKFAQGTASSASNSVTAIGIPDAPTVGTASAVSATSATVTFTAPSNTGGLPITSYTVVSSPGNITKTGSTSPITITGLTTGTSYTFTVYATNSLGNSSNSAASNTVSLTVPNVPTIGVATMTGRTTASVSFTAPVDNGSPPVTGYTVISTPGNITVSSAGSPVNISGLTFGIEYTFKVYATNLIGNSSQSSASNAVVYIDPGQVLFSTLGTTNWVVPAGVTSISAIAVGGGAAGSARNNLYEGNGGGGGGLSWSNDIPVTSGETLTVVVGNGGQTSGAAGQNSTISRGGTTLLLGDAANGRAPGRGGNETAVIGQGGSSGGTGGLGGEHQGTQLSGGGGGGGAGGYDSTQRFSYQFYETGSGADYTVSFINTNKGEWGNGTDAPNGSGAGGGGAAGSGDKGLVSGRGGGVGVYGLGADGTAGIRSSSAATASGKDGSGGSYGYGGYGGDPMRRSNSSTDTFGKGGQGAVRIIWPGTLGPVRQFPSTKTEDIIYVDYLLVGGGGGGGTGNDSYWSGGGGGGAGGVYSTTGVLFNGNVTYTITVGAGGSGGRASGQASNSSMTGSGNGGSTSISGTGFTTASVSGGGGGGNGFAYNFTENPEDGKGGASGGGGAGSGFDYPGSRTTSGGWSSPIGFVGGNGFRSTSNGSGGGGGGAGAAGINGSINGGGSGGSGKANPFPESQYGQLSGGQYYLAGGGGGAGTNNGNSQTYWVGAGGLGGGGSGRDAFWNTNVSADSGTSGYGGGGGGLVRSNGGSPGCSGGSGGSGVAILRFSASLTPTTVTGSPTITTVGNYKYYRWNGNGSIRF